MSSKRAERARCAQSVSSRGRPGRRACPAWTEAHCWRGSARVQRVSLPLPGASDHSRPPLGCCLVVRMAMQRPLSLAGRDNAPENCHREGRRSETDRNRANTARPRSESTRLAPLRNAREASGCRPDRRCAWHSAARHNLRAVGSGRRKPTSPSVLCPSASQHSRKSRAHRTGLIRGVFPPSRRRSPPEAAPP